VAGCTAAAAANVAAVPVTAVPVAAADGGSATSTPTVAGATPAGATPAAGATSALGPLACGGSAGAAAAPFTDAEWPTVTAEPALPAADSGERVARREAGAGEPVASPRRAMFASSNALPRRAAVVSTGAVMVVGESVAADGAGCTEAEAEAVAGPTGALITAPGSVLPTDGAVWPGVATDGTGPETRAARAADPALPPRAATDGPPSRPADPDPADGESACDDEESPRPPSAWATPAPALSTTPTPTAPAPSQA
jgi:hypothetical protein